MIATVIKKNVRDVRARIVNAEVSNGGFVYI